MRHLPLLVLLAATAACSNGERAPDPIRPTSTALVASQKGGAVFVKADLTAVGDAKTDATFTTLWTGPGNLYVRFALQGPSLAVDSRGSFLTYESDGTSQWMRGRTVSATGVPSTGAVLSTFQGATHGAAIPSAPGTPRDVFLYSRTSREAEIWRYQYDVPTGRWTSTLRAHYTGFGAWDRITGYPDGVLFFSVADQAIWRGRYSSTGAFEFESLATLHDAATGVGGPYDDVAYVEGLGHAFYRRSGEIEVRALTPPFVPGSVVMADADQVIGLGNSSVLLYRSSTGAGQIVRYSFGGIHVGPVQTYAAYWEAIARVE